MKRLWNKISSSFSFRLWRNFLFSHPRSFFLQRPLDVMFGKREKEKILFFCFFIVLFYFFFSAVLSDIRYVFGFQASLDERIIN